MFYNVYRVCIKSNGKSLENIFIQDIPRLKACRSAMQLSFERGFQFLEEKNRFIFNASALKTCIIDGKRLLKMST